MSTVSRISLFSNSIFADTFNVIDVCRKRVLEQSDIRIPETNQNVFTFVEHNTHTRVLHRQIQRAQKKTLWS